MSESPLARLAAEPDATRTEKGTFHTPGEILQQPWLWRDTAGRVATLADRVDSLLRGAEFALFTGAGSSLHAARIIEDAAKAKFGPNVSTVSCTDLMLSPEAYVPRGRKSVVFSLSRSGESPEAVEAARVVAERFPEAAHVAITCNARGTLARLVSAHPRGVCLTLHEKAYDKGLGTTSSMTGTVVAGQLLVDGARRPRVEALAQAAESVLARADWAEAASKKKADRVVVLGTGPLEVAAQEVAHKVMELTDGQVPTMARNYLEFRHGPIAFVNDRTLILCLLSPDPHVARYERDFVGQTPQMRVRWVEELRSVGPDAGEAALLGIVYGQMMALFISIERGLRPDRPGDRGLVNPVVQGVTIYPRES